MPGMSVPKQHQINTLDSVPAHSVKPDNFYRFLQFYHRQDCILIYENSKKYLPKLGDLAFVAAFGQKDPEKLKNKMFMVIYGPQTNEDGIYEVTQVPFNEKNGQFPNRCKSCKCEGRTYPIESWVIDELGFKDVKPRYIINGLYKLPNYSWEVVKEMGKDGAAQICLVEFNTKEVPWKHKMGIMKKVNVDYQTDNHLRNMDEALMLLKLRHSDRIVQVFGVNYLGGTAIFIEACPNNLFCFLKTNEAQIGQVFKLKWTKQAAEALKHTQGLGIVHRAIQTKNCYLTEDLNLKIGGFEQATVWAKREEKCYGQLNQPYKHVKYEYAPSLVRWLSPETLGINAYGLESEVWSYGMMVYEIFADGAKPYPGFTDYQVKKMLKQLFKHEYHSKLRHKMPKACPVPVSKLILSCWSQCAMERPLIETISSQLNEFYEKWAVPSNMISRLTKET